jgi:SpoIID/LytB domain protein
VIRRFPAPGRAVGRGAVVALAVLLVVALVPAAGAPATAQAANAELRFDGRGFGHGRGLGQWGALGYAVDRGRSYSWILGHFYGGTSRASQSDAPISVRLVAHDRRELIVTSASAFTVGSIHRPAGSAARVRRAGDGTWVIDHGPGTTQGGNPCTGPWAVAQRGIDAGARPEARLVAPYGGDDVRRLLQVCELRPDQTYGRRSYRGTVMALQSAGVTYVVNHVPMEQYLRGVVPRESPASWGDLGGRRGMEQLKAQAVAARSYAWAEGGHPAGQRFPGIAKTCDTTTCQVYGGAGLDGTRIEYRNTDLAVAGTAGEVRRHADGRIARTEFSSSTGGHSAGGTFPAVVDEGDAIAANPNHRWTAMVPVSRIEAAFPAIGRFRAVRVLARNGLGADGGRVLRVSVQGSAGAVEVTGLAFRTAVQLRSDWFTVSSPLDPPPPSRDTTRFACPAGRVPPSGFVDIRGNTFASQIECLAWYGITSGGPGGRPANQYVPTLAVNRAQMATFLARMLDRVDPGILGPADGVNRFTDVATTSPHVAAVNRLARAGIVSGGAGGAPPSTFAPDAVVSRGQMASFVARALQRVTGTPTCATIRDFFADDAGDAHEACINGLTALAIVGGTGPGRYSPARPVTRDQLAAFVMRTVDLLVEQGRTRPPA